MLEVCLTAQIQARYPVGLPANRPVFMSRRRTPTSVLEESSESRNRCSPSKIIASFTSCYTAEVAGSKQIGDEVFNEIFHPISRRLIHRIDAVLRIGGESRGADEMVILARKAGKRIYSTISEIAKVETQISWKTELE
jgi:Ribonuclease G/E